jgi:hypothetical protein
MQILGSDLAALALSFADRVCDQLAEMGCEIEPRIALRTNRERVDRRAEQSVTKGKQSSVTLTDRQGRELRKGHLGIGEGEQGQRAIDPMLRRAPLPR